MTAESDSAWRPFEALRKAIEEAVEPLGVELRHWAVFPDIHGCNIVFHVDPDVFKSPEQKEVDTTFEEMMLQERHNTAKDKAQKIVSQFLDAPDE